MWLEVCGYLYDELGEWFRDGLEEILLAPFVRGPVPALHNGIGQVVQVTCHTTHHALGSNMYSRACMMRQN